MINSEKLRAFCNKKAFKFICIAFMGLVGLLAIYSFVKTPFTGDIKVFMAAANQVKYQDSNWLMSIFESWELKAIGSRFLMYIIYLPADLLVGFENKTAFECACKLIYAAFVGGMLVGACAILPLSFKRRFSVFAVLFFAFFATGTAVQMQVEMTCIAICILAAACLIRNKTWSLVLCGFLGSTLFFFKSLFILLFASVLLCGAVYNRCVEKRVDKRGFVISSLSMLGFELPFVALTNLIYPQEFTDMAHAAEYQSTMLSDDSNITLQSVTSRLGANFVQSTVMIPVIILGVVATIFVVIRALKQKDHITWLTLMLVWLISLDIIVVSNTYFIYHYFLLVLPSLLSILLYFKAFPECRYLSLVAAFVSLSAVTLFNIVLGRDYEISMINASTVLLVCLHLFFAALLVFGVGKFQKTQTLYSLVLLTVCFFLWANFLTALAPYYKNLRTLDMYSVEFTNRDIPDDISENEVLFLDAGSAAFYIDAPSYSRYFFNLPLQRWTENDDWDWKEEELKNLMAFDGKYVVIADGWFDLDKYPELWKKLSNEYRQLEADNLRLYSPNWTWYYLTSVEDYVSPEYSPGVRILVRK